MPLELPELVAHLWIRYKQQLANHEYRAMNDTFLLIYHLTHDGPGTLRRTLIGLDGLED